MALTLRVSGGIPADVIGRTTTDILRAQKAAVAGATAYARQKMREAIRARSTSTRLPNIMGEKVYPAGTRLAWAPAGEIFPRGSKAALILKQMAEGATIRVRDKKALAIPLHNRRDARGALLAPKWFPTLVYIPNRQRRGASIGILALPSSKTKRGVLRAADRKQQAAKSRARVREAVGEDFIPMFVLVRAVRIPRVFDPEAIMREAIGQMPALFSRSLSQIPAQRAA